MRSEVESLLKVDRFYKTLQQIDLSAFSQAPREIELYWNVVFWFKHINLPYLWLCPYSSHLGEWISQVPVDRAPSSQPSRGPSRSAATKKEHRPCPLDSSNPKRALLLQLFRIQRLKKRGEADQHVPGRSSTDRSESLSTLIAPSEGSRELGSIPSSTAASDNQPQGKPSIKKRVADMTKDEKMRAAEQQYMKRKTARRQHAPF